MIDGPERSYREMVHVLRQFDGPRALWRLAAGALLLVGLPIGALAVAALGIYLAGDLRRTPHVVLGAAIALVTPVLATWLWRQRLWRTPLACRLRRYETIHGGEAMVTFAVPRATTGRAVAVLRRAKLNPHSMRLLGTPPADASKAQR